MTEVVVPKEEEVVVTCVFFRKYWQLFLSVEVAADYCVYVVNCSEEQSLV